MIENWQELRLSNVADIYSGYAFKSKEMSSSPEEGVPLVKIKNIFDRKVSEIYDSYLMNHYFLDKYDKYILIEGDILVAMTGQGSVGRIGKMYRVKKEILVNQRVGMVRINPSLADKEFVYQQIATSHNESVYFNLAMGAGQPNLSPRDIGNLKIQLPPLPTQRKIAAILSAYDDLIENNLKRIKLLEEKAQLTYEEWFVRMKFPGHETTPIDEETGLPEGWEEKTLQEVANINAKNLKTGFEGTIEYIDIASVSVGTIDQTTSYEYDKAPGRAKRIVGHGDIIVSCVRPNRRSHAIVWNPRKNLIASTGFCVISPKKLPSSYLLRFLSTDDFVGYLVNRAGGAAYPAVKAHDFEIADVICPSEGVLNSFDREFEKALNISWSLKEQNQLLKEARDLLLPRLMTGMIDVDSLDLSAFEQGDEVEMLMAAEPEVNYTKS